MADLINLDKIKDAPTHNRIVQLHPKIQQFVINAILDVEAKGVGIRIAQGLRTFAEQDALYAQGRTAPGKVVTYAKGGQSYHNYGVAIDFVLEHKDGSVSWSMTEDMNGDSISDWNEVVQCFLAEGFTWGGSWPYPKKDTPHFEMTFGLSFQQMLNLKTSGKVDAHGYIII